MGVNRVMGVSSGGGDTGTEDNETKTEPEEGFRDYLKERGADLDLSYDDDLSWIERNNSSVDTKKPDK